MVYLPHSNKSMKKAYDNGWNITNTTGAHICNGIEKTLVLLKPCTMQRALAGEIISIFEKKGLQICGMKMMRLTDALLSEHYAHLSEKPFFQRVKDAMMTAPVVAICLSGVSGGSRCPTWALQ